MSYSLICQYDDQELPNAMGSGSRSSTNSSLISLVSLPSTMAAWGESCIAFRYQIMNPTFRRLKWCCVSRTAMKCMWRLCYPSVRGIPCLCLNLSVLYLSKNGELGLSSVTSVPSGMTALLITYSIHSCLPLTQETPMTYLQHLMMFYCLLLGVLKSKAPSIPEPQFVA